MADQMEYALQVLKVKIATAYRAGGTPDHRHLSELENKVFDLINPKRWIGGHKFATEHGEVSQWIAVECGGNNGQIGKRRMVSACGADADLFWSKLEREELSLWGAALTAAAARKEAKKSERPLRPIIARLIDEYVARVKSAHQLRVDGLIRATRKRCSEKAKPSREGPVETVRAKRVETQMAQPTVPGPTGVNGSSSATGLTKAFKANLTALVDQYLRLRLEGLCDPSELRQLIGSAVTDVTVVCDEVIGKVSYRRSNPQPPIDNRRVSRSAMLRACDMISYRMPTRSGRPDMEDAKKWYRKLSARYHPDKTGSDERLTAQYLAVQEAWKTIEQWNEENRS